MRKMFSQNQIKSIVNEGISSGEISAGTKLYLHIIALDEGENSTLCIISTHSTQYEEGELVLFEDGILMMEVYDENTTLDQYITLFQAEDETYYPMQETEGVVIANYHFSYVRITAL